MSWPRGKSTRPCVCFCTACRACYLYDSHCSRPHHPRWCIMLLTEDLLWYLTVRRLDPSYRIFALFLLPIIWMIFMVDVIHFCVVLFMWWPHHQFMSDTVSNCDACFHLPVFCVFHDCSWSLSIILFLVPYLEIIQNQYSLVPTHKSLCWAHCTVNICSTGC